MISATAKLLLQERTIVLECAIAPDNVHIAPTYQDFLDKYDGPISVDVEVFQERDANGVVMNPGHAMIRLSLKDADDLEVIESDEVPDVPATEENVASSITASGSVSSVGASSELPADSSLRIENAGTTNQPPQTLSPLDLLKASLAAQNKDKEVVKL